MNHVLGPWFQRIVNAFYLLPKEIEGRKIERKGCVSAWSSGGEDACRPVRRSAVAQCGGSNQNRCRTSTHAGRPLSSPSASTACEDLWNVINEFGQVLFLKEYLNIQYHTVTRKSLLFSFTYPVFVILFWVFFPPSIRLKGSFKTLTNFYCCTSRSKVTLVCRFSATPPSQTGQSPYTTSRSATTCLKAKCLITITWNCFILYQTCREVK